MAQAAPATALSEARAGWWSEPVVRGEGTQTEGSSMQAGHTPGLPVWARGHGGGGVMVSWASRDNGPTPLAGASWILSPQGLTPSSQRGGDSASAGEGPTAPRLGLREGQVGTGPLGGRAISGHEEEPAVVQTSRG